MKIRNQNTIPSKYVLLILVIVCGILLGAERFLDGGGPLSWIANYTIVPMQRGISYAGTWMSDVSDNFATLSDLRKENEQLQIKMGQYFQKQAAVEKARKALSAAKDPIEQKKLNDQIVAGEKQVKEIDAQIRKEYGLPYGQDRVIEALAEVNKNLVVVNISGKTAICTWPLSVARRALQYARLASLSSHSMLFCNSAICNLSILTQARL